MERACKLPRAQAGNARKPLNRQVLCQMRLRENECARNAIRQWQHLRILGLATTPSERHHKVLSNRARKLRAIIVFDQRQRQIYASRNSGR